MFTCDEVGGMNNWFVSTVRKPPGAKRFGVVWTMKEFDCEEEAKRYASAALAEGLRVEAGVLAGSAPKVRVPWRHARDWTRGPSGAASARPRRDEIRFAANEA
jgi:hypothetical protein